MKNRVETKQISQYWKIISGFLLLTNILAIAYFMIRPESNPVSDNPYPLIDISRNFIPQEHFIVGIQPLRDKLEQLTDEFGRDSVSIYIEYLNTGANISINKDNYIWPASLSKLPLAMAVVKKVERGEWELSNELVLLEGDRNIKSGEENNPIFENPIGTRFTIEKLLEELLVNSDNTAYNILLRNLHNDDVEAVINELGLEELFTKDGKISAKEYSRIFRSLYTASFLSRKNSQMLLKWLDDSPFNNFLANSIPSNIPFPHKYGENLSLGVYADSGIVYLPNRPYLISVMVKEEGSDFDKEKKSKAEEFHRKVSKETYDYFSKYLN